MAETVPVLSAAYVVKHLPALEGQVIRVRGWFNCSGWGCLLYPRTYKAERRIRGLALDLDMHSDASRRWGSDDFHLWALRGRHVELEGRVNDVCSRPNALCLDWGSEFHVMRVIAPVAR